MKVANVIIGAYVNGYSILQELFENGIDEIIVLDTSVEISCRSNRIKAFYLINNTKESILEKLEGLKSKYDLLVLYPNQDIFVEHLCLLHEVIKDYCFTAFNPANAIIYQNKLLQYEFCTKLGVPCPQVISINEQVEIENILQLNFPVLIKPVKRDNLKSDVFRNKLLNTQEEYSTFYPVLSHFISESFQFIASEVIPGDGSNIYAYTGYRKRNGTIVGEWIGKKLSQFPDDFGVFSSASNEAPEILIEQSRKLLNGMDLWGINEPEYKYDYRDGRYKLMEINLRPMMWHRVGALSGVPLNYIQYLDATNNHIPEYIQDQSRIIHYVYLNHEIINLLTRKAYLRIFLNNLFKGDKTYLALWDRRDPKPFIYSFFGMIKRYKRSVKRKRA